MPVRSRRRHRKLVGTARKMHASFRQLSAELRTDMGAHGLQTCPYTCLCTHSCVDMCAHLPPVLVPRDHTCASMVSYIVMADGGMACIVMARWAITITDFILPRIPRRSRIPELFFSKTSPGSTERWRAGEPARAGAADGRSPRRRRGI